jgi:hypothetical protein
MAAERRMPVRTATIVLNSEYEGWQATMRTNPPLRVYEEMQSGTVERVKVALAGVIVDWNFVDEAGEALPASAEGVMALPADLLQQLITAWQVAVAQPAPFVNGS